MVQKPRMLQIKHVLRYALQSCFSIQVEAHMVIGNGVKRWSAWVLAGPFEYYIKVCDPYSQVDMFIFLTRTY
jgi:hypothetical protein